MATDTATSPYTLQTDEFKLEIDTNNYTIYLEIDEDTFESRTSDLIKVTEDNPETTEHETVTNDNVHNKPENTPCMASNYCSN